MTATRVKKPSRYDHDKQDWLPYDIFPNCKEQQVICPLGYPGHMSHWLNTANWRRDDTGLYFERQIRIIHAHFVSNRDTGRHVGELIDKKWVHEKYTVVTRRLDYSKMPEWLKDEAKEFPEYGP